eukprot:scaffold23883_cov24-Tisochrysis_lutea.AAC.3
MACAGRARRSCAAASRNGSAALIEASAETSARPACSGSSETIDSTIASALAEIAALVMKAR